MDIETVKDKVAQICTDLGNGLPYDSEQCDGETWPELADYLQNLARFVCIQNNKLAGYAGHARRTANRD